MRGREEALSFKECFSRSFIPPHHATVSSMIVPSPHLIAAFEDKKGEELFDAKPSYRHLIA